MLLIAALARIQLGQHELWAGEAASLVHSGRVVPYLRGAIRDADGRTLVQDVEAYHLVFRYRDFRRNHPIGQVAHGWSALLMRPVPLVEAAANLDGWSAALVGLTPETMGRFSAGEDIVAGGQTIPGTADPRGQERARRAADVRFYVRGLLGAEREEWSAMQSVAHRGAAESRMDYLGLLALQRQQERETIRADMVARNHGSIRHLSALAGRLNTEGPEGTSGGLAVLVEDMEYVRIWVENASAGVLFREALGFPAGRVVPGTLLARIDLDWLRTLMRWDESRLEDWALASRVGWKRGWRDGVMVPRLLAQLRIDAARTIGADDVLSELLAVFEGPEGVTAALDGTPVDWRDVNSLAVFGQLDEAFETRMPRRQNLAATPVLPPMKDGFRDSLFTGEERWQLLDYAVIGDLEKGLGARMKSALVGRGVRAREDLAQATAFLLKPWEERFQEELARALKQLVARADPSDLSPDGRLLVQHGSLVRAAERSESILRDYGRRLRLIENRPGYEVVHLLTRYPERFPGFEARDGRERVAFAPLDADAPMATSLIGVVSAVGAMDLQRQRSREHRLRELRAQPQRKISEEAELISLVGSVLLHDEIRGVSGIEGLLDTELRGRHGYREHRGLEDVFGQGGGWVSVRGVQHGRDVQLTLRSELQRAAERTLENPRFDPSDVRVDLDWFQHPVGAIVLVDMGGDVLAAASVPTPTSVVMPSAPESRRIPMERTLRRPTFQPPGSVFKPFVAAMALELIGLDPDQPVDCAPLERGGAGYGDLRCHARYGHGPVALNRALTVSCNAYFAWLGEQIDERGFDELSQAFGFGRPTGVRAIPAASGGEVRRFGLAEDFSPELFRGSFTPGELRRAANGLARVEATPMQMARATVGLATGRLPGLRIVHAIGGDEIPRLEPTPLPVSKAHLDLVRAALVDVAAMPWGTAHRALRADRIGFAVAAKTGSADLTSRSEDGDVSANRVVRKHTWVTTWFPSENPVAAAVVFMHDTSATSSHGAVYVMRQFLTSSEVRGYLSQQGVVIGPWVEYAGAQEDGR